MVAEASTSYTTKADKNIAIDYRNELTHEICNVTLAHLDILCRHKISSHNFRIVYIPFH